MGRVEIGRIVAEEPAERPMGRFEGKLSAMLAPQNGVDSELRQQRSIVGIGGAVYLCWWFAVEFLLPGSFNPLLGRLLVVGLDLVLLGASYRSRWAARHLSTLFAIWV